MVIVLEISKKLNKGNMMKRILLLLLFIIPLFSLSGCTFFITATTTINDESITKGARFWFKKGSNEQASNDIYTECYYQGRRKDLRLRGLPLDSFRVIDYKVVWYQGECLHNLGYVFKENIFSKYCYHDSNEKKCQVFRNFKH